MRDGETRGRGDWAWRKGEISGIGSSKRQWKYAVGRKQYAEKC